MAAAPDVGGDRVSVAEFLKLPEEEGYRLELSRGMVVREPAPGPRHGRVAYRVLELLRRFEKEDGLGLLFFDTAFLLSTDDAAVRVPDVAFVSAQRVPPGEMGDEPWALSPDLVVEVLSPANRASEIQAKALEYLRAGSRLVWVLDPAQRTVSVYRSRSDIRVLAEGEVIGGEPVLPDLAIPVEDFFD